MKERKTSIILTKIENSFKLQIFVCTFLCFLIILGFYIINKIIDNIKYHEYTVVDNIELINSIESFNIENDNIVINGYAFLLNKDSNKSSISMLLRSVDTDHENWLNMKKIQRTDVNNYFNCDYNYENSGFIASIKSNKLKSNQIYEILINIDYNETDEKKYQRTTVSTNKFILNNKLYSYNPNEFDQPDSSSDLLNDIFQNGELCLYQKNLGLYIYQYNGKIYWITNNNFEFDIEGSTYIIYHVYTSQINKLPEKRIQYKFDNLDFYFEDLEVKDEMTESYRVVYRDIPQDYAITYIKTGVYDDETNTILWTKTFQLNDVVGK